MARLALIPRQKGSQQMESINSSVRYSLKNKALIAIFVVVCAVLPVYAENQLEADKERPEWNRSDHGSIQQFEERAHKSKEPCHVLFQVIEEVTRELELGFKNAPHAAEEIYLHPETMTCINNAAEEGNPVAQLHVGLRYLKGIGIPKNYEAALRWLHLAGEQGNRLAQVFLGGMYLSGEGLTKDYNEALKWYRLAADHGNSLAKVYIGMMHLEGKGVPQDYGEALKWLRLAADQHNSLAYVYIGIIYVKGEGVAKDYSEALKWFRMAADARDIKGLVCLGKMYYNGYGVTKDNKEAERWFRMAAEQGDEEARQMLEELKKM